MDCLKNQLVVVTGGTKGIGKAIVERFSMAGANIAVCSRNEKDLQGLKAEIESKHGNHVFAKVADVSKKKEVNAFVGHALGIGAPISVLVNNVGRFIPGQIHKEEEGTLESQLETNLYSAYRMSRGVIPAMIEQRDGHIFNISSIAGLAAYPNGGSYSISKFAMYGMSKSLREELKEYNIRVTSVMPGATLTASWDGSGLPEDRFIKPGDVADLVYSAHQISKRSVVEDLIVRPQLGDL